MTYPDDRQRTGHFARFAKALFRSDAVSEFGQSPIMLALFVAAQEDRVHYRKAPRIWRSQIMDSLDIGSPRHVIRIRNAAMEAGLIHYVEGSRTKAPEYWTMVPDWLLPYVATSSHRERETLDEFPMGTGKGTRKGTRKGTLSYPIPINPLDGTRKSGKFTKPSLVEVQAYCLDRKNFVNAQHWIDHYESNGWKVGRNSMKDWKASVRTWERNGMTNGKPQEPVYEKLTARRRDSK